MSVSPSSPESPLTAQVISFYLSYLSQSESGAAPAADDSLLCVDCSVSYLACQVGIDAAPIVASLEPGKRKILLAPVNDNPDVKVRGERRLLLAKNSKVSERREPLLSPLHGSTHIICAAR